MNYPLISEYVESIRYAEDNFATLTNLRPMLDEDGNPIMSSGNFAVVFKMQDIKTKDFYAIKCFTREQEGRNEAYRLIEKELDSISAPFVVSFRYYDSELFVNSTNSNKSEFPILLMDWVDGINLQEYIERNQGNHKKLLRLSNSFSMLATWLLSQEFAHGDIKPDNIIIHPISEFPIIIDYDGMYVPAMNGSSAREMGSPNYRHPSRTREYFNRHIDDFSLALIQLYIDSVCANSKLTEPFNIKSFVLDVHDFVNNAFSKHFDVMKIFLRDVRFTRSFSRFLELIGLESNLYGKNANSTIPYISEASLKCWEESIPLTDRVWIDIDNVKYTKNWESLICFPHESQLTTYTIKYGCKRISKDAFEEEWDGDYDGVWSYGNKLKNIKIPNTIEAIEDNAFVGCHSLEALKIPNSVKEIGVNVFPKILKKIDCCSNCFITDENCLYSTSGDLLWVRRDMQSFSVPEGVTYIHMGSLDLCSKLEEVIFPKTLIGIDAPGLPDSIKKFSSKSKSVITNQNCVYTSDGLLVWVKKDVWYFEFPFNIKTIGKGAFNMCTELRNLSIPQSIESINDNIGICRRLDWIYLPDTISYIKPNSLKINVGQDKYSTIYYPLLYVPRGTKEKFLEMDKGFDESRIIEVDSQITPSSILPEDSMLTSDENGCVYHKPYFGNQRSRLLHYGKHYLSEYSVKEGTEVICDYCFNDMYDEMDSYYLSKLSIPSSVCIIGSCAFNNGIEEIICYSPYFKVEKSTLFSIDGKVLYRYFGREKKCAIPDGVEVIIGGAFSGLEMESIIIPKTVKIIGDNPFAGIINNMEEFKHVINITNLSPFFEIRNGCLIDKDRKHIIAYLEDDDEVELDDIASIGANAFYAKNIKIVRITSNITYIDEYAFGWCFELKNVAVPSNEYTKRCNLSATPYLSFEQH